MDLPKVDDRFSRDLLSEDALGAVVRAHIHVEAAIRSFVESKVASPKHLPKMAYEGRLRLAVALGFDDAYLECLKYLVDLRNEFGHNLGAQLTEKRVNEFFGKTPKELQK